MDTRDVTGDGVEREPRPLKDQAKRLSTAARERLFSTADERKGTLAEQVKGFANGMEGQGRVGSRLAGWLREIETALETRSTEDLLRGAERRIKAHPGAFIAGCVALGFLGARLVRG